MANRIHPVTDETLQRVASALERMTGQRMLYWDEEAGEYDPISVANFFDAMADGRSYGFSMPKGSSTVLTKLGSNAGIAAPTPGIIGRPCADPYVGRSPFFHVNLNASIDSDGEQHFLGFEGDGRFSLTGSNGNVFSGAPVLYRSTDETDSAFVEFVSTSKLSGMSYQPGSLLPSGKRRPCMTYAKYPLSMYDGSPASVSGTHPRIRDVSHNSLITICGNASGGYSGKSYVDDWYVQVMFWLKYGTKNSQSVFAGCSSYNYTYPITVAESGVTRAIIAKANAANLVVGSSVCIGTSDRGQQVCADSRIVRIEDYDSSNSAVYLDAPSAFTTTTSANVYTVPWECGCCDGVEGDGSPTNPLSAKQPFTLQGIELAHGMTEVLGDVIISNTGDGWEPCTLADSRNAATSLTSDYEHTGVYLLTTDSDGWKYPLYAVDKGGLLVGQGAGGSQTTGLCDGNYTNMLATTGTREWRGLGSLGSGGNGGLRCVGAYDGLGITWWSFGSRLSGHGRKGVNAV